MKALPNKDKQYIVTFKMTAVVLDKSNEISQASEEPLVKFKKDSPLEQFLLTKTGDTNKTCMEILTILKDTIKAEELYDARNPSIIFCSQELEKIFNCKALHLRDLMKSVLHQIEETSRKEVILHWNRLRVNREVKNPKIIIGNGGGIFYSSSNESHKTRRFFGSLNLKFGVQPGFCSVLRSVEGADKMQTEFSMSEILQLFSKYMISKKDTILDQRNVTVAMVENDPLGKAFKVAGCHRSQARALLDQQLVCLSLKQEAAWRVVRCLGSKADINLLEVPNEVKGLLVTMMTPEEPPVVKVD